VLFLDEEVAPGSKDAFFLLSRFEGQVSKPPVLQI
jgi:hypothetical protein